MMTTKVFWLLVGVTVGILFFSYSAFSHDLFNYMFDVRIIAKYQDNPYMHKALDYQGDLWVRFMHWTHRTYPYGPVWLIVTVPLSMFGMEKFVLTMGLFRLLFTVIYIGNIFLIHKLLKWFKVPDALWNTAFFAFNPLIIIESLVSPHLDSVMLFFWLLGLYFFSQKKKVFGFLSLIGSAGVKFVTIVTLPLFFIPKLLKSPRSLVNWSASVFLLALTIPVYQRELYAWYFIPFVGMVALSTNRYLQVICVGISIAALLRYAPYFYFGEYGGITQTWQQIITATIFFTTSLYLAKTYARS